MRELFLSERRYIANIVRQRTGTTLNRFDPVLLEHYAQPRSRSVTRFNNDFFLQFVPQGTLTNHESYSTTILPNTIGADVFVTIQKETRRLLRTELLSGEAFPIRYFEEYCQQIEERLKSCGHRLRLAECAYCRVFVIQNDICFLVFPAEKSPIVSGNTRLLCSDSDLAIQCASDSHGIICFDGWIHTSVAVSEQKMVALQKDWIGAILEETRRDAAAVKGRNAGIRP